MGFEWKIGKEPNVRVVQVDPIRIDELTKGECVLNAAAVVEINPSGERTRNGVEWFARRVAREIGANPDEVTMGQGLDLIHCLFHTEPPRISWRSCEDNIAGGYVYTPPSGRK